MRFPRVLVTGATGLLGQPLVTRLTVLGYAVTALGKRRRERPPAAAADYGYGDLADRGSAAFLDSWRWDAVVHLAGSVPRHHATLPADYATLSEHVGAVLNVCLAVPNGWSGRFVLISGMNVYGAPQYLPVDEAHPISPINVYGAAKALAENVATTLAAERRIDLWTLRVCGLFTKTRRSGAIFRFLHAAVRGEPLVIWAPVPTPWDVVHVDDAVEAIIRVLDAEARGPGAVNIGYGEAVDLVSIAKRIVLMTGSRSSIQNQTDIEHPVFQMNVDKARQLLGWHPPALDVRLDHMRTALEREPAAVDAEID